MQRLNRFISSASHQYMVHHQDDILLLRLPKVMTPDLNFYRSRTVEVERLESRSGKHVYSYRYSMINYSTQHSLRILSLSPIADLTVAVHYSLGNGSPEIWPFSCRQSLEGIANDPISGVFENDVIGSLIRIFTKALPLKDETIGLYERVFYDFLDGQLKIA